MARYPPSGSTMSVGAQRVVVIQDASREINSSAIKWAINGLSLKPGDELTLLGVLHQVNTPSTFPFMAARKLMGYKSKVDSNSMLSANPRVINEELSRKEEEFHNSKVILEIYILYEMKQITFRKQVVAASSPKVAALEAAMKLEATWIILDRQMKKDKKYFMEMLSCGISRMKRNNSVELLRGPIHNRKNAEYTDGNQSSSTGLDGMLRGLQRKAGTFKKIQESPDDDDLFSFELVPTKSRSPAKNSSSSTGEIRIDNEERSLGTSMSYENLPNIDQRNHQISLGSSSNEAKYSSYQVQGVGGYVHTQREAPDDYPSKTFGAMNHETGKKQSLNFYDISKHGVINKLERSEENPVADWANEEPKFELKIDFTYDELCTATDGFSDKNFLSEGGFGSVFKGRLKNGQRIAVKQHKHASWQGEKEFRSEVQVLSKARHKNVVMLLGSCSEGNHRLLVYEYVSNGSLDTHLSTDTPNVLSWEKRMNIALGAARGLNYLHRNNILHRDMRPNNILLNHNYEPLLGDFGLARAQHTEPDHSLENNVVGTIGYLAPEYAEKGRASTKTDVYSFGVVLLELITGRTTMDKSLRENSLLGWARPLLKERKYPELIDERIGDCHDVHQLFGMICVAEKCLCKDPDQRPSMEKVECLLTRIMDGETVSMYEFFPTNSSYNSLPKSNESQGKQELDLQDSTSSDASPIRTRMNQAYSTTSLAKSSSRSQGTSTNSGGLMGKRSSRKKRVNSRTQPIIYDEMLD